MDHEGHEVKDLIAKSLLKLLGEWHEAFRAGEKLRGVDAPTSQKRFVIKLRYRSISQCSIPSHQCLGLGRGLRGWGRGRGRGGEMTTDQVISVTPIFSPVDSW